MEAFGEAALRAPAPPCSAPRPSARCSAPAPSRARPPVRPLAAAASRADAVLEALAAGREPAEAAVEPAGDCRAGGCSSSRVEARARARTAASCARRPSEGSAAASASQLGGEAARPRQAVAAQAGQERAQAEREGEAGDRRFALALGELLRARRRGARAPAVARFAAGGGPLEAAGEQVRRPPRRGRRPRRAGRRPAGASARPPRRLGDRAGGAAQAGAEAGELEVAAPESLACRPPSLSPKRAQRRGVRGRSRPGRSPPGRRGARRCGAASGRAGRAGARVVIGPSSAAAMRMKGASQPGPTARPIASASWRAGLEAGQLVDPGRAGVEGERRGGEQEQRDRDQDRGAGRAAQRAAASAGRRPPARHGPRSSALGARERPIRPALMRAPSRASRAGSAAQAIRTLIAVTTARAVASETSSEPGWRKAERKIETNRVAPAKIVVRPALARVAPRPPRAARAPPQAPRGSGRRSAASSRRRGRGPSSCRRRARARRSASAR